MNMESVKSTYNFENIPFENISCLGQKSLLNNDMFCVSWVLHRYCNYKCSYCWPHGRTDKKDFRSFESIKNTLNQIKVQARERTFNSFAFSFSGGEPTLHPKFLEIQKLIRDDQENCNYQSVHMTTNLSKGKDFFSSYMDIVEGIDQCRITASFHKEYIKDLELFTDKLIYLQDRGAKLTINMVIPPNNFDAIWTDALHFHKNNLNVTLKPQSDKKAENVVKGYTDEQLELLKNGLPQRDYRNSEDPKKQIMNMELVSIDKKKYYLDQAERLNALNFNRFAGWECSAGTRSIVIREPGGEIKRSYSCQDKILGTVDTGFKLYDDLNCCITPTCVSSADNKIPKRIPGFDWPLWASEDVELKNK